MWLIITTSPTPSVVDGHHTSLEGLERWKNYPAGFSILSSSMAIVYSEVFGLEIIALGILEF